MYAYATRDNTTTDLTPQEIHEIGLERGQTHPRRDARAIIDKLGFRGSFAEFAKLMRSDPKFYFKTESEVLEAYRALRPAHSPVAGESLLYPLPRMPYGIEPVPANIAPDSPAGLYRGPAARWLPCRHIQCQHFQAGDQT